MGAPITRPPSSTDLEGLGDIVGSAPLHSGPKNELPERTRGKVGLIIGESRERPHDAEAGCGPDADKLAAHERGELPDFKEDWVRAIHDVNKELADYIRERLTVRVVGSTRFSPSRDRIRKDEK